MIHFCLKSTFEPTIHQSLEQAVGMSPERLAAYFVEMNESYVQFDRLDIKNGRRKWRHIDEPSEGLKETQSRLNDWLQSHVHFPPEIIGGVRGRSAKDHAMVHIGQPIVVAMDIADYFPNVTSALVYRGLWHCLGWNEGIARLVMQLSTFHGYLPHGAPTSTLMANIASAEMFLEIARVAAQFQLRFSVYVDDLAVSGMRAREAIGPICAVVRRCGHVIRRTKTMIMPRSRSQRVVGHVVNRYLSAGTDRIDAIAKNILEFSASDSPTVHRFRQLQGQVAHVRSVNREEGLQLVQLLTALVPEHLENSPTFRDRNHPTCKCYSSSRCKWRAQRNAMT